MRVRLKLVIQAGARKVLERNPSFHHPIAGRALTRLETTTYFDTADSALAQAGVSLAIRRAGKSLTQSIAVRGDASAGIDREESQSAWEWPLKHAMPDLVGTRHTPVAAALSGREDAKFVPVFTTIVRRTLRRVDLGRSTRVSLILEEGSLIADGVREPIDEIMFDLLEGALEPVYRLARELHEMSPLTLAVESRCDRGYRVRSKNNPESFKAAEILMPRDIGLHDAVRQTIGAALMQLLANLPATQVGDDPEGIHQMRVAIRRLRSLLAMFKKQMEPPAASRFGVECRELGRVLGAARDWDVFVLETLPKVAESDGAAHLAPLHVAAEAELRRAHEKVQSAISDPRFTGLVLALLAWVEGKSWARRGERGKSTLAQPLMGLTPAMLDRLARKVGRDGRKIGNGDREALHDLRKSLKQLRYGIEYLGCLFPHVGVRHYLKPCGKLLEALGTINDTENATHFAQRLAQDAAASGGAPLTREAEQVADWCKAASDQAEAQLHWLWRDFTRVDPFWR